MLRHLEEKNESEINRDAEIDPEELELLLNFYVPEIKREIELGLCDRVTIISSDKVRSQQTADLLKKEVSADTNIPIIQEEDSRTSAENHGKYRDGTAIDNPLTKKAKSIYLQETFEKKNIWYKYGSTTNETGEEIYPELKEIFAEPGESQIEINVRIYRFILDLLDRVEREPKTQFILSTHYIVMSRILSLQHMTEQDESFSPLFYQPTGELYQRENEATENMIGGWEKFYDFFKSKNFVFNAKPAELEQVRGAVEAELDILTAQYMQRYGKKI